MLIPVSLAVGIYAFNSLAPEALSLKQEVCRRLSSELKALSRIMSTNGPCSAHQVDDAAACANGPDARMPRISEGYVFILLLVGS